jgi:protoheme IX farnesyltransferase
LPTLKPSHHRVLPVLPHSYIREALRSSEKFPDRYAIRIQRSFSGCTSKTKQELKLLHFTLAPHNLMIDPQEIPKLSSSDVPRLRRAVAERLRDYIALTKPEINALILISTAAGGWLACASAGRSIAVFKLASAVIGTAFVASGAGALNQALESRFDALMSRTMRRPVAAGRLSVFQASTFGILLALSGAAWMLVNVNATAALLASSALGIYILAYTPLKRRSPVCIFVGAVAGAVPPLIGWFACEGAFGVEAGLLFSLLFLWQLPHFMAIGWICRNDYERAGYQVIPRESSRNRFIGIVSLLPALGLFAVTLSPLIARDALIYLPAVCTLGIAFLFFCGRLVIRKTNAAARQLLAASIYYLPLALALLILIETYRSSTY